MARPKGQEKLGGRRKGTPNKNTAEIRAMVVAALDKAGGEQYLVDQAKAHPKAFLTLVAKLLPTQVTGEDGGALEIALTEAIKKGQERANTGRD